MTKASLLRAATFAPIFAAALITPSRADDEPTDICPAIVIDDAARNAAYYPGEPGRNRKDYSHIAVILSAVASCVETDDEQIVATVRVTYAVEAGPLYRGAAKVTIKAWSKKGGSYVEGYNTKETPLTKGTPVTVTDTTSGMIIGSADSVEEGGDTIVVGLDPANPPDAEPLLAP
jgi:hypothetical protein